MPKWEYCAIRSTNGWVVKSDPALCFYNQNGVREEKIAEDRDALAKTIARLGDQGWEMVGCGSVAFGHAIYFKRPITQ